MSGDRYAVTITRAELVALNRVLSTQIQRPLYEHDQRIRAETAAIEAFMDRAIRALKDQQEEAGEGHAARMGERTA